MDLKILICIIAVVIELVCLIRNRNRRLHCEKLLHRTEDERRAIQNLSLPSSLYDDLNRDGWVERR
jgi:hypothetical protein